MARTNQSTGSGNLGSENEMEVGSHTSSDAGDLILEVEGHEDIATLFHDRLVLRQKGLASRLMKGRIGTRELPVEHVTEIRIRRPTLLVRGLIRFIVVEESRREHRSPTGKFGEFSIVINGEEQYKKFLELKTAIDALSHSRRRQNESEPRRGGLIMEVQGKDGVVTLYSDRVALSQKGLASKVSKGSIGVNEIRIDSITGVQLKRPSRMTAGFVQFISSGGGAYQGGVVGAARDESSMLISNDHQYDQIVALKKRLDQLITESRHPQSLHGSNIPQVSIADELAKLMELRDRGVISDAQFENQKNRLLGE